MATRCNGISTAYNATDSGRSFPSLAKGFPDTLRRDHWSLGRTLMQTLCPVTIATNSSVIMSTDICTYAISLLLLTPYQLLKPPLRSHDRICKEREADSACHRSRLMTTIMRRRFDDVTGLAVQRCLGPTDAMQGPGRSRMQAQQKSRNGSSVVSSVQVRMGRWWERCHDRCPVLWQRFSVEERCVWACAGVGGGGGGALLTA